MEKLKVTLIGLSVSLLCGSLSGSEGQEDNSSDQNDNPGLVFVFIQREPRHFPTVSRENAKEILGNYLRKAKVALRDFDRFKDFLAKYNDPGKSIMHSLRIIAKVKDIEENDYLIVHPAFAAVFEDGQLRESLKKQAEDLASAFDKCWMKRNDWKAIERGGFRDDQEARNAMLGFKEEVMDGLKNDARVQDAWMDFCTIAVDWFKADLSEFEQRARLEFLLAGNRCICITLPNGIRNQWSIMDYRTRDVTEDGNDIFDLMGMRVVENLFDHIDEPQWD